MIYELHGGKGCEEYEGYLRMPYCDLLCVISDSIPLEDEIARIFMNFIFGCMHCSSTFNSSLVRSAFTNINSNIGKKVRLCALTFVVLIRFFKPSLLMGGGKNTGISRLLDEIETKFQQQPQLSMTAIPMELSVKLSDVTGNGKSKMAASKLPK